MKYLLVVEFCNQSIIDAFIKIKNTESYHNLRLLIITQNPHDYDEFTIEDIIVAKCDFSRPESIISAIAPYYKDIAGVVCRKEKNIQHLRKVIPHLPPEVLVSSAESLATATNKHAMRTAFLKNYPHITPRFVSVKNSNTDTLDAVANSLDFPVIVKPAGLASSMLVQKCTDLDELKEVLAHTVKQIEAFYKSAGRSEKTEIIIEEFLEGNSHLLDTYIDAKSTIIPCPFLDYVNSTDLGVDDFSPYKCIIPSNLSPEEKQAALDVVQKAVWALGLVSTTAHVELIKTKNGWKVVEVGPRIGRFKQKVYNLAYGFDHAYNDLLLRLGETPLVPSKLIKPATVFSIYPRKQGYLKEVSNLKFIQNAKEIHYLERYVDDGAYCAFAKNGGLPVVEFVVSCEDVSRYNDLIQFVETNVKAVVESSANLNNERAVT